MVGVNVANQHTIGRDTPWRDEEVLRELYINKQMSTIEIGEQLDVASGTVGKWLHKHDIPVRKPMSERLLKPHTTDRGYVVVNTTQNGEGSKVYMHRLLAVSEYGFDAVCDKVVHHENNIRWDNRPDNIKLTSQSEHIKHHVKNEENGSILTKENVREIRDRYPDDCTLTHLAEKFGVSLSTVYDAYNRNTFKWVD